MLALGYRPVGTATPHEAGRGLLRQMYEENVGIGMPPIAIAPGGKPYFVGSDIHFSITHTHKTVFCALSRRPIGIDAEEMDRQVNPRLAQKILSPGEMERYSAETDKNAALLRLWVLKEAAAKQTGKGIHGYPNQTDFSPDDPRIQILSGCYLAIIESIDN